MFGSSTSNGVSPLSNINLVQRAQAIHLPNSVKRLGKIFGAGRGDKTSASISSAGQLLANLHQLQAQDPAKFKQVTAGIAAKLQAAAQQAGPGTQAKMLADLAAKFQNVSAGGSLSQLAPQSSAASTPYAKAVQNNSASLLDLAIQNGNATRPGAANGQQLLAGISTDVSHALKNSPKLSA
jgi:hypothetical protein